MSDSPIYESVAYRYFFEELAGVSVNEGSTSFLWSVIDKKGNAVLSMLKKNMIHPSYGFDDEGFHDCVEKVK